MSRRIVSWRINEPSISPTLSSANAVSNTISKEKIQPDRSLLKLSFPLITFDLRRSPWRFRAPELEGNGGTASTSTVDAHYLILVILE